MSGTAVVNLTTHSPPSHSQHIPTSTNLSFSPVLVYPSPCKDPVLTYPVRHIRTKAGNEGDETGAEFASFFPHFLWVVRDFTLQLVDENNGHVPYLPTRCQYWLCYVPTPSLCAARYCLRYAPLHVPVLKACVALPQSH
eukprot:556254-Rhodomonas_salina.4